MTDEDYNQALPISRELGDCPGEEAEFYWLLSFHHTKEGTLTKIKLIRPLINPPSSIDESGNPLEERTDFSELEVGLKESLKQSFPDFSLKNYP